MIKVGLGSQNQRNPDNILAAKHAKTDQYTDFSQSMVFFGYFMSCFKHKCVNNTSLDTNIQILPEMA